MSKPKIKGVKRELIKPPCLCGSVRKKREIDYQKVCPWSYATKKEWKKETLKYLWKLATYKS